MDSVRPSVRACVRPSVRSSVRPSGQISLRPFNIFLRNFTQTLFTIFPWVCRRFRQNRIQNGRPRVVFDRKFSKFVRPSKYLQDSSTFLHKTLHTHYIQYSLGFPEGFVKIIFKMAALGPFLTENFQKISVRANISKTVQYFFNKLSTNIIYNICFVFQKVSSKSDSKRPI